MTSTASFPYWLKVLLMILLPEMKDDGFPSSYFRLFAFAFLDEYNLSNISPH